MNFNLYELEPLILVHSVKDHLFFLKIKDLIKEEYFTNIKLAKIFSVLKVYYEKYMQVPQQETLRTLFNRQFKEKAEDYIKIINEIFEYTNTYDEQFITTEVINFIKQAKIIEAIKENYQYIEEPEKYQNIAESINKAVSINIDKDLGIKFTKEAVEVVTEEAKPRMPTGFNQLDTTLGGGLEEGCVYVFSGVYGTGKSIWLQNIAVKLLLQNRSVAMLSLELSEHQVTRRLTSCYAQIKPGDFSERKPELIEQFKQLNELTNSELYIKEYPTGTASSLTIKGYLQELIATEGKKPDVLIVDYANIMKPNGNYSDSSDSYGRTKKIYEELRSLAQEIKIPIVTAAQINRGGMDEKSGGTKKGQIVTGANISDSMGINMTADVQLIINQTAEDKLNGIIKLYVDKNRQGKSGGMLQFGINYDFLLLTEDFVNIDDF